MSVHIQHVFQLSHPFIFYDLFFSTGFIDKNNDLLYKNIKDVSAQGVQWRIMLVWVDERKMAHIICILLFLALQDLMAVNVCARMCVSLYVHLFV